LRRLVASFGHRQPPKRRVRFACIC
jgi:hypothetical protein